MKRNNITIYTVKGKPLPEGFELVDLLGKQVFNNYFNGTGFDCKAGIYDWFFYGVPEKITTQIKNKVKNLAYLTLSANHLKKVV